MAIDKPQGNFLGTIVNNFPKKQYEKIAEIIDELNSISDEGVIKALVIRNDIGETTVEGDLIIEAGSLLQGKLQGSALLTSLETDVNNVTQITSITTGVTTTKISGVITTVSSTLAGDANAIFTVTNTNVSTTSRILLTLEYTGNGQPFVTLSAVANGSFNVRINNSHSSQALNAALKIHFLIIN